jgi:MurNAc alpha-1-phosphate uridylyltransferase
MVLAAGRGERMRPLTDNCPKPLLHVRGLPLLAYPLRALHSAGVSATVINTGWLGDQIEPAFGPYFSTDAVPSLPDASPMALYYSHEGRGAGEALETAGGIARALPLLDEVFWVAAGDVYVPGFEFSAQAFDRFKHSAQLAHIWLVPNPAHNPGGDFGLSPDGLALNLPKAASNSNVSNASSADARASFHAPGQLYTFSTIALYKKTFFSEARCGIPPGNPQGVKTPLAPLLRRAMDEGLVSGSIYTDQWVDVGTPERLAQLNAD